MSWPEEDAPSWRVDIHGRGPGVLVATDGFAKNLALVVIEEEELELERRSLRHAFLPRKIGFEATIGFVDAAQQLRRHGTLMLFSGGSHVRGQRVVEFAPGEKEKFLVWLDRAFDAGFGSHTIKVGNQARTNTFTVHNARIQISEGSTKHTFELLFTPGEAAEKGIKEQLMAGIWGPLSNPKEYVVVSWARDFEKPNPRSTNQTRPLKWDNLRKQLFRGNSVTLPGMMWLAGYEFVLEPDDAQGLQVWLDTMSEKGFGET